MRTRPDIVARWSDLEVAARWLRLFPKLRDLRGTPIPPTNKEISALADCPERIAQLRRRLSNLSWFMGRLNEFIARAANKEDNVKGRFWESRFKCQALLDVAAIACSMVYVDLNPIRAGLSATPEESDFTSIQERIRAWRNETTTAASLPATEPASDMDSGSPGWCGAPGNTSETSRECPSTLTHHTSGWLCPIQSESQRRGILDMTTAEYFDLVDKTGRMARADKPGAIAADLAPILLRIGANPGTWLDTVSHFGSKFRLAAGRISNLRDFADRLGRRWFHGTATARLAFVSSPPQVA